MILLGSKRGLNSRRVSTGSSKSLLNQPIYCEEERSCYESLKPPPLPIRKFHFTFTTKLAYHTPPPPPLPKKEFLSKPLGKEERVVSLVIGATKCALAYRISCQ